MKVTHAYTFYELQFPFSSIKKILDAVNEGARSTKADGNSHPHIGVIFEDHLFSILLSEPQGTETDWVVHMWNSTGLVSVGYVIFKGEYLPLEEMKQAMSKYISGKGSCARCKKEIDIKLSRSKGHTIYAGTYCDDCWTLPEVREMKNSEGL